MSDAIIFDGVRFISAADAAERAGLTRNYIYQLCKAGWLNSRRVGKHTYIEEGSIQRFLSQREELQTKRREELSRSRASEYRKHNVSAPRGGSWLVPAGGVVASVLAVVILVSAAATSQFAFQRSGSLAAAGSSGVVDSLGGFVYHTLCPLFHDCPAAAPLPADTHITRSPVAASTYAPAPVATTSRQNITNVYNTYPVTEHTVEVRRIVAGSGGISAEELNQKLNQLDSKLSAQIHSISLANSSVLVGAYQAASYIAPSTSSGSSGSSGGSSGTVTSIAAGAGLSGGTITTSGTLSLDLSSANTWTALQLFSANASSTQLSVFNKAYFGGTATSSFDNAGNLTLAGLGTPAGTFLAVNATGKVIATTTPSGGGSATWGAITGTLSSQTDLQAALDSKLSLSAWYATTTTALAEGTNKYWTDIRFDNRLSATTTLPNITTLANLASVGTITSGMWSGLFGAVSGANLTNLTAANISAGTAGINVSGNAGTVTNGVYTTTFNGLFDTRFVTDLAATSSVASITTLSNLATVGTITSGTWSGLFGAVSGANLTHLTAANIDAGTAGINVSGNAGTATALQTARTINGVSFNGTADITVFAASSTLLANSNTFSGVNSFTGNTTFTNATTTNLFSTTASSTNLFSTNGTISVLSAGTLNLTSTLNVSGLSTFAGLISTASSTIGNGTQTGGLTVSGGATTTGSQYIGGGLGIGTPVTTGFAISNPISTGGPTVPGVYMGTSAGYNEVESYNTSGSLYDFSGTSGRDYDFRQLFDPVANTLSWAASTTPNQLVLGGNGNIGIGIAPGASKLTVAGSVAVGGNVFVAPTANSLQQGFTISQTGPTTGTQTGTYAYNSILVNGDAVGNTVVAQPGFALKVDMNTGGTNESGSKGALYAGITHNVATPATSTKADHIAAEFFAYGTANDGGTDTGAGAAGTLFGTNPVAWAGSGATNLFAVVGEELDTGIFTGAGSRYRFGSSIVSQGDLNATGLDTAIEIGATSATGWQNALTLTNANGQAPLTTTATVIGTDGSANTIGSGMDLSSYTITNNFLKGPNNFVVKGNGSVGIGTTTLDGKLTVDTGATGFVSFRNLGSSGLILSGGSDAGYNGTYLILSPLSNTSSYAEIVAGSNGSGAKNLALNPSAGNVGIGTTSPWRTLSVTGTAGFDGLTSGSGTSLCLSASKELVTCTVSSSLAIGSSITSSTAGSILYVNSSNQLAQDNANFFWDATNHRLGIGTTSPWKMFSVAGDIIGTNITATGTLAVSGNSTFAGFLSTASSTITSGLFSMSGGASTTIFSTSGTAWLHDLTLTTALTVANGGTGAATLTGLLQGNGTGAITGITGTAGQFPYYNGASTLLATSSLFLATSGNVGIGTVSPGQLLDVGGTLKQGIIRLGQTAGGSVFDLTNSNLANASGNYLNIAASGGSGIAVRWDGLVGIGTTTPDYPLVLNVANAGVANALELNHGGTNDAWFGVAAGAGNFLPNSVQGDLAIRGTGNVIIGSGYNANLYIKSGGNVGIAFTTPWAKLSVKGADTLSTSMALQVTDSNNASLFSVDDSGTTTIGNSAGTGDAVFQFAGDTNAWAVGYKSSDKSFNIASSTNLSGTAALSIAKNGNTTIAGSGTTCVIGSGTGATNCTSDSRLKTNIVPISGADALAGLAKISGVTFNWADPAKDQQQEVGVIAQDVQQAFPQLVGSTTATFMGQPGSYLTVDYAALVSPLISAVNELNLRVNPLDATTSPGELVSGTASSSAPWEGSFAGSSSTLRSEIAALADTVVHVIKDSLYAAVGIFQKVFAGEIHTDKLCVSDSTGETCVTKSQLDTLLAGQTASAATTGSGAGAPAATSPSGAPIISVNGNNPATVNTGTAYVDLGASITSPQTDLNLGISASVDGGATTTLSAITVDTSVAGTHTIVYSATDQNGLTGTATRTVNVVDLSAAISTTTDTSSASTTSATSTTP